MKPVFPPSKSPFGMGTATAVPAPKASAATSINPRTKIIATIFFVNIFYTSFYFLLSNCRTLLLSPVLFSYITPF
ncbi:MAG: hypothetical protein ACXU9X_11045, partial [Thermodesulfobacteriota bacterium]